MRHTVVLPGTDIDFEGDLGLEADDAPESTPRLASASAGATNPRS